MVRFLQLLQPSLSIRDYPSTYAGLQVSVLLNVAMKDYEMSCVCSLTWKI